MMKMKAKIMKRAHEFARKMEGDYAARLALALRQAWREARQPKELPSEVTFKFDTGKQVETIRLNLNRWTKYGKDRIYVNEGRKKVGFLNLQNGKWTIETVTNMELYRQMTAAVETAVREAGLI